MHTHICVCVCVCTNNLAKRQRKGTLGRTGGRKEANPSWYLKDLSPNCPSTFFFFLFLLVFFFLCDWLCACIEVSLSFSVFLYAVGTCSVDFQMHIFLPANQLVCVERRRRLERECPGVRRNLFSWTDLI